jgi:hypothetical protein
MPELILEQRLETLDAYHAAAVNNPGWDRIGYVFDRPIGDDRDAGVTDLCLPFDARAGVFMRDNVPPNEYVENAIAEKGPDGQVAFDNGLRELNMKDIQTVVEGAGLYAVLGGNLDSMAARALHTRACKGEGRGYIAYVGSERELKPDELQRLQVYAPGVENVRTEAQALWALLGVLHPERELVQSDTRFRAYETPAGQVYWANAPSTEAGRADKPANTRDLFRFLGKTGVVGGHIVVVTQDIYQFQGVAGRHILEGVYGADLVQMAQLTVASGIRYIEDAGFGAYEPKPRENSTYAQELLSQAKHLARLKAAIEASQNQ